MARPVKYTLEEVLENAMHAFWLHGYEATSLDILLRVTGLSKSSLYNTFGGKRALFIQTLEFYGNQEVGAAIAIFQSIDNPQEAVRKLLNSIATRAKNGDRRGCLLCNTSTDIGSHDAEISRLVQRCFKPLLKTLNQVFQSTGMPSAEVEPQALQILAIYTGLQIMSRGGYTKTVLKKIIDHEVSRLN